MFAFNFVKATTLQYFNTLHIPNKVVPTSNSPTPSQSTQLPLQISPHPFFPQSVRSYRRSTQLPGIPVARQSLLEKNTPASAVCFFFKAANPRRLVSTGARAHVWMSGQKNHGRYTRRSQPRAPRLVNTWLPR